jgi:3-hydroxybutyryl-CoA dehydrogenase
VSSLDQLTIGVVGAGVMGLGIAEASARAGCNVTVVESFEAALASAPDRLQASLLRAQKSGRLAEEPAEVLARVTFADDYRSLADADIVIEAIRESVDDKLVLIAQLDEVLSADAVIASNTSSIPIARLANGSQHPGRVIGLHFFNPVTSMPLVEVVPSLLTDARTTDVVTTFAAGTLGKQTVLTRDRAGFLVNAILVPYLLSAIRTLEQSIATRDDIDAGMVGGCGMPMGPLRLCDMIGLDTMLLVSESLYAEHLDPSFAPPALLRRHVDAGWLGRKSGRGFYDYQTA